MEVPLAPWPVASMCHKRANWAEGISIPYCHVPTCPTWVGRTVSRAGVPTGSPIRVLLLLLSARFQVSLSRRCFKLRNPTITPSQAPGRHRAAPGRGRGSLSLSLCTAGPARPLAAARCAGPCCSFCRRRVVCAAARGLRRHARRPPHPRAPVRAGQGAATLLTHRQQQQQQRQQQQR